MKYRVQFDEDYGWDVEEDDPDYDGPETSVEDQLWTYHVEAENPSEAIKLGELEMAIDS